MRATDTSGRSIKQFSGARSLAFLLLILFSAATCFGQAQPSSPTTPPPSGTSGDQQTQGQQPQVQKRGQTFTLKRDVDLVRMQVSIVDKKGNFVPELQEQNFKVWENGVPQKIAAFTGEDIPITVGLVIDNSGSMKSKRPRVNEAALEFVKTSNPQDEVFVVNFNDEYYLDMDTDFTNDQKVLKQALERIDSRGGTALYDTILGSIAHLKKGTKDRKILLVVTDGVDDTSDASHTLDYTVEKAAQSNTIIYAVGLFSAGDDSKGEIRQGERALRALTQATGGETFFPKTLDQVDAVCQRIAQDIREQYTIGYYPTNTAKDGTFRLVKIELASVKGHGKLSIRTRPGYYAPTETTATAKATD
ncbi:MAG TPA: VWA domain-containing protein [Candidatus Acidoferrales bacterium]|nr:VWA domain-containing protein [Candidatus Acidoferrales bacterium]